MTPTQIRTALEQLGGRPNKSLGQHFLIDKTVLEVIIEVADIKSGDRVLEVGPGLGVLTRALLERGANVVAVEKDKRLAEYLFKLLSPARVGERCPDAVEGRIEGLAADASKLDWDQIMGSGPWKFVSNLPYAITSLALRKALYAKNPPTTIVVLIQREVAERIIAPVRGGKTSLLSLMVCLAAGVETPSEGVSKKQPNIQIIRRVSAGAFYPPPKVESAILRIIPCQSVIASGAQQSADDEPHQDMDKETVMKFAKQGFAHPRKLLQRNLGIENNQWQELSERIGFDKKVRAEDLTVGQWVKLTTQIKEQNS